MSRRIILQRFYAFISALATLSIFVDGANHENLLHALTASYLVAVYCFIIWCIGATISGCRDSMTLLSMLFLLVLGPIGAFMIAIIYPLLLLTGDHQEDIKWLFEAGKEQESGDAAALLYRRLLSLQSQKNGARFFSHESIAPFLDTIRFGALPEKRRTLAQIGRYYTPYFLPALTLALEDPANIVRVHAASIMTLITGRAIENEIALEKELNLDPNSFDAAINLAKAKAEHVQSGLLDPAALKKICAQGVELLRSFELRGVYNFESRLMMLNFLIRSGRLNEARPYLRWLIRDSNQSSRTLRTLTERWLLDSKKYAALIRYSRWNAINQDAPSFYQRLRAREESFHVV